MFDRNNGPATLCRQWRDVQAAKTEEGIKSLPCPSPDGCPLAQGGACKPYGRLNVAIGDDDPLGSFIFRTTGFNSIRTLSCTAAVLPGDFRAIGWLACRWNCGCAASRRGRVMGTPIYYVDLTIRAAMTLEEALADARQISMRSARRQVSIRWRSMWRHGPALANGAFEDAEDEGEAVVEEFFPEGEASPVTGSGSSAEELPEPPARPSLRDKLDRKAQQADSLVLADPELP